MLEGEAQELFSERAEHFGADLLKKAYKFQVQDDDGLDHFRGVSRQYPTLGFVLVYADPNSDDYGSYFISQEKFRRHRISDPQKIAVMNAHGVTGDGDDDDERRFWDATWELMDIAEAHWRRRLLTVITKTTATIPTQKITGWKEGLVDCAREHFELCYNALDHGLSRLLPVALVGPPKAGIVEVQFLVAHDERKNVEAVNSVVREIQFYLIEKKEPRPWSYAKYHCGTMANLNSKVYWSFHESADQNTSPTKHLPAKRVALSQKGRRKRG